MHVTMVTVLWTLNKSLLGKHPILTVCVDGNYFTTCVSSEIGIDVIFITGNLIMTELRTRAQLKLALKLMKYSGPSLIRIAWDQSPFRLVKFSD